MKRPAAAPATFIVETTPAARVQLVQRFISYDGPFEGQGESKAFRGAFNVLELGVIQETADRNRGALSATQAGSHERSTVRLTFDEVQVLRKVANAKPRNGAAELALGELIDDLDAILDGTPRTESRAARLSTRKEDWTPPKVADAPVKD